MSAHGNHGEHGHNDHDNHKNGTAMSGFLIMAVGMFLAILFFKFLFFSEKDTETKKEEIVGTHITKSIYVKYGPEFKDITYLPSGFDYYFEGATEPYCYINKNGCGNCGEKNEDATGNCGDGPQNKALRFKSQNGKSGHLKIILIKK